MVRFDVHCSFIDASARNIGMETMSLASLQLTSSTPSPSTEASLTASFDVLTTTGACVVAVIAARNVALDSKLGTFTVIGSNEPCVVRLCPHPSCSCLA